MYELYLEYHHIPAGAILQRILHKENMNQKQLAAISGLRPQRINDFILGKRRINAEFSFQLETALRIDLPGYFYILQANHDIFTTYEKHTYRSAPDISKIRKTIFWDTDFKKIDWEKNYRSIIRRIFEYGDKTAITEIKEFYGIDRIVSVLNTIKDGRLADRRNTNLGHLLNETAP